MAHQYNQLKNDENNQPKQGNIQEPIYYQNQPTIYQTPQPVLNNVESALTNSLDDKHSSDHTYSLTFLILGIFTFFPLLANVIYLKSPHCSARKHALASVIIATCYLLTQTIVFSIFYANYINNQNWYNNNH